MTYFLLLYSTRNRIYILSIQLYSSEIHTMIFSNKKYIIWNHVSCPTESYLFLLPGLTDYTIKLSLKPSKATTIPRLGLIYSLTLSRQMSDQSARFFSHFIHNHHNHHYALESKLKIKYRITHDSNYKTSDQLTTLTTIGHRCRSRE